MTKKVFTLLDLAFHECKECLETHLPFMLRDKLNLYYQLKFYKENGRYPTWEDAMADCPAEIQKRLKRELKKCGLWTEKEAEGK